MQAPRRGPGRVWYGVAAGVLVVGLAIAGVMANRGIEGVRSLGTAHVRAVMPGTTPFTVTETGEYILFHEYRSTVDGTVYSNPEQVPGLQCLVVVRAGGTGGATPVRLSSSSANYTYSFGSRSGVSVAEFTVETPGEYLLTCAYSNGRNEPRVVMVVGRPEGFIEGIFSIIGAVGVGLLAIIAAIVIFAVTLVKRRNANRPPPPPFGPYPGYAPQPPYGPPAGYGQPPPGYPPPGGFGQPGASPPPGSPQPPPAPQQGWGPPPGYRPPDPPG